MSRSVLISVRYHDGRYHGTGDGPPSPARLFQALVAGAGLSGPLASSVSDTLEWLENRDPPIIAAPVMTNGQTLKNFVPNNDFDAVGGDPRRVGGIRTSKIVKPRVFDACIPFLYVWEFKDGQDSQAQAVCTLAERVYQLGRGVDLVWAWGEVLDAEKVEERLSNYQGMIYRPSIGGGGRELACPQFGSLKTLKDRYTANRRKFKPEGNSNSVKQLFSQQPKPRFAQIAYDSPPLRYLYELRLAKNQNSFAAWPLAGAHNLVVGLRDGARERLRVALPERCSAVDRILVGRKDDGADERSTSTRVRIIPLPSVGHHFTDHRIRRVMVEVPADSTLRADDVRWAFSGLEILDPTSADVPDVIVTPATDESMLAHYGIGDHPSRVWRTVTPAVLPEHARRRRIDPARIADEAKGGVERAAEQKLAGAAVVQALRHADVHASAETIRVQREPFDAMGERVEAFAPGTRFPKERLWHVQISFFQIVAGPLVIGDGRFLGLGLMAPIK